MKNSSLEILLMLVCLLLMLSLICSFIGNLVFMLVLNIIIVNSSANCHKFHCGFVCKRFMNTKLYQIIIIHVLGIKSL